MSNKSGPIAPSIAGDLENRRIPGVFFASRRNRCRQATSPHHLGIIPPFCHPRLSMVTYYPPITFRRKPDLPQHDQPFSLRLLAQQAQAQELRKKQAIHDCLLQPLGRKVILTLNPLYS
jgi:hypothetical protein